MRRAPPTPPAHLLAIAGQPEEVFGPNMRFRRASILLGAGLLLLGVGFLAWFLFPGIGPAVGGFRDILRWLAAGLVALGGAAIFYPLSLRYDWVYVCPGGLIRTRGVHWDAVAWGDIRRFDDCTLNAKGVTARQCRVVTATGEEWGFLADWVADYDRLMVTLREKLSAHPGVSP